MHDTKALSTKQRLEAVDEDVFEHLTIRYLSDTFPELRGIAVTGLNDEGKPIPCPVDGVHYLPGPEPRWVFVASTTIARQKLRGKWIGTSKDAGDVAKAAQLLQKWKSQDPDLRGSLILATNRMLGGDADLYQATVQEGTSRGLDTRVVEGSALLRYLDHNPEGQVVRQELLGVPANRLSLTLLKQLCQESLGIHWQHYGPARNDASHLIARDVLEETRHILAAASVLVGLQGASGQGKSMLAHLIAQERSEEGDAVLWVSADRIVPDAPLATTLTAVLQALCASLNAYAGEDALRLIAEQSHRLILLVDDINRTGRTAQLVRTVEGWTGSYAHRSHPGSGAQNGAGGGSAPLNIGFIVPLWPNEAARLDERRNAGNVNQTLWRTVTVGRYSQEEQMLLQQQHGEHSLDFQRIVNVLAGDPFLCGLVSPQLRSTVGSSRSGLIRRIFEDFVSQAARAAEERAQSANMAVTSYEVIQAVDGLIDLMIDEDTPDLAWHRVRERLGARQADILYHVAFTNQLGWLVSDIRQESWHWKHARLRDALVGRRLAAILFPESEASTPSDLAAPLFANPGLSEAWAMSLVYLPTQAAQICAITLLGQHAPLALAHALRLSLFPNEVEQRSALLRGLKDALADLSDRVNEFIPSLHTLILEQLSLTDDDLVLEIARGLPGAWDVDFARVRNGDMQMAIDLIARDLKQRGFTPATNYRQLETAIEAFGKRYVNQRITLLDQLEVALQDGAYIEAAVLLMGYLAWPEFSALICASWRQYRFLVFPLAGDTNHRPWLCYLWSLGRCCTTEGRPVLEEVLLGVAHLDDEHREDGATQRYLRFGSSMKQAMRFSLSHAAAQTWVKVATDNPAISRSVFYYCRHQEEPSIIEAYVRWYANVEPFMWGEFMRNSDVLHDPQPIPQDARHDAKVYQSKAVLDRLWEMVTHETEPGIRKLALAMWKRSSGPAQLGLLQSIGKDDPLFDISLEVRVRLNDETAAAALADRIRRDPVRWCGYAPRLYGEREVREAFLDCYAAALTKAEWDVSDAPKHLPAEAVPEFVRRLSPALSKASRTWVPLLLTDVPEALAFVQEAIGQARREDMELLFSFSLSSDKPLTRTMLDALTPVLWRFENKDLTYLVEQAVTDGQGKWVLQHLSDFVTGEEHVGRWLTDADILNGFDELARRVPQGYVAVRSTSEFYSVVRPDSRRMNLGDSLALLRGWLGEQPSDAKITVAALVVAERGIPNDLFWWSKLQPGEEARPHWENVLRSLKISRWKN